PRGCTRRRCSGRRSARGAALDVVRVDGLGAPREHLAQVLADRLDRVGGLLLAQLLELRGAVVLVIDEALREGTGLDVREDRLHVGLRLLGDHAGAGDVVAVLGGVGDRPALLGDAALVHEVDDELELVQHLEVGDLGLVARLGEGLEAGLDQVAHAAAEHRLLTEQVGLGLLGEGGLDDAGAGAADALGVGEGQVPGRAARVLLDGDDVRDAAAGDELAAHGVARRLRRDEQHVHARGRLDVAEADVEAVGEGERLALAQVGLDRLAVHLPLILVRGEDHDQIGPLGDLRDGADGEALLLGLGGGLRALAQAHADLDAAVAQVQRVGMALGAEADDSDLLALDDGQVGVVVVEDLSHDVLLRCGVRATGRSYRPVSYVVRVGLWMWDAGAVDAARGQDSRLRSVIARPPRPIATSPDFTISRMPKDSSIPSSAVSLSCVPVASMVTESAAASTTFARNICTISSTGVREELSAVTLMRMSSRWTVERASSWTIFSTFTSLLSCLVI